MRNTVNLTDLFDHEPSRPYGYHSAPRVTVGLGANPNGVPVFKVLVNGTPRSDEFFYSRANAEDAAEQLRIALSE